MSFNIRLHQHHHHHHIISDTANYLHTGEWYQLQVVVVVGNNSTILLESEFIFLWEREKRQKILIESNEEGAWEYVVRCEAAGLPTSF